MVPLSKPEKKMLRNIFQTLYEFTLKIFLKSAIKNVFSQIGVECYKTSILNALTKCYAFPTFRFNKLN